MRLRLRCSAILFLVTLSFVVVSSRLSLVAEPPARGTVTGEKTTLRATDAVTTGNIRRGGQQGSALTGWTDRSDTVTWEVNTEEGGVYDVSITYAAPKGEGGAEFEVASGTSSISGEVQETGGRSTFVTLAVGLLTIPKGAARITVRARTKPGAEVMVLRELVLERGYEPLFDGKTVDGWFGPRRGNGQRSKVHGYEVIDGVLTCMPGGNIYTEKEYGDFVFRFEFRLDRGSNNGLGIRTPDHGDAAYVGMEIQIIDDDAPQYRNIRPWQRHGSIYHVVPAKTGHLRPPGQWNVEEVIADGRDITVRLNGVTIVQANLDEAIEKNPKIVARHPGLQREKGYIGFLGHGSKVEFRNIRLKELTRR